jgi:membrane protein insertase Oxa1/YidC/SpoIIIJ
MIRLLNWLESTHNWRAIIFLVIIVRAAASITKKTQVNMVKMQQNMGRLQPKMDEIKKKYANDNRKMQEEIMKLNGARHEPGEPSTGCLPMFCNAYLGRAVPEFDNNGQAAAASCGGSTT